MQYAEENYMKALSILLCPILFLFVLLRAPQALSYATSQEEQWAADLVEAKARAKDFKKHLERVRKAAVDRDKDAHAEDAYLKKQAEEYDRERAAYARYRATLPTQEQLDAKMDAEVAKQQAIEDKKEETTRKQYVLNRNIFEAALEKNAFIDEAEEYDVHSSPSVEWQNAHKPPDLLKFKVEESKTH